MDRVVQSTAVVVSALWVGVLFILAARHSPAVPDSGVAADLIGPLLYGSDLISLAAGAALLAALAFLRRRGQVPLGGRLFLAEAGVGVAAAMAAANDWWFAPRIRLLQGQLAERYGAFHRADRADPLFARFDGLHRTSTTVFLVGLAAALLCLVCLTQFRPRRVGGVGSVAS